MLNEKFSTSSEIVILDGITYKKDNLDTPLSGTYNWIADDGSDIASFYEKGKCISRIVSENGVIKSRTIFKDNDNKEIEIFDQNGQIRIRNQMLKGKLEGLTEIFSDGVLVMATEFSDGKKNGQSIVYNNDGSVSYREYFINDVKQSQ